MQKTYAKIVEWYGGKESYLNVIKKPIGKEVAASYDKRLDAVLQKLADKRGCPVDAFEVREIVAEYGEGAAEFFADAVESFYQRSDS